MSRVSTDQPRQVRQAVGTKTTSTLGSDKSFKQMLLPERWVDGGATPGDREAGAADLKGDGVFVVGGTV